MTRRIVAVSAGVAVPSSTRLLADQILGAVTAAVGARGEGTVTSVIELRELATGLATTMVTGLPTPEVAEAVATVAAADGLIAVTPVFTAGYSGLFKTFFDVLGMAGPADASEPAALAGTPVLIAATAGTPRHSLVLDFAMRPLFTYLHAVVVPTGVFAATEDFGAGAGGADLTARITRAASELAALVVAEAGSAGAVGGFVQNEADRTRGARDRTTGAGAGASAEARAGTRPVTVTPFEELLRGHTG